MKGQTPLVFIWAITALVMFTIMPLALAMMLRTVRQPEPPKGRVRQVPGNNLPERHCGKRRRGPLR